MGPLTAELPAQLAETQASRRHGSDIKQLHGKAPTTRTDAGLEPAGQPAQLQLKQPADQLVDLRQGETTTTGPPGAMGRCPQFKQRNPVRKGMGHGMPCNQGHQLHLQTLSCEMTGGNQGDLLSAPRSEMRQHQPQIITACSRHLFSHHPPAATRRS